MTSKDIKNKISILINNYSKLIADDKRGNLITSNNAVFQDKIKELQGINTDIIQLENDTKGNIDIAILNMYENQITDISNEIIY